MADLLHQAANGTKDTAQKAPGHLAHGSGHMRDRARSTHLEIVYLHLIDRWNAGYPISQQVETIADQRQIG
jgi:hypothetical protein